MRIYLMDLPQLSLLVTAAQIIGLLAFAINAYAMTHRHDQKFFSFMIIAAAAWILHFALMGAWPGAISSVISFSRYVAARYLKKPLHRRAALICVLFAYGASAYVLAATPVQLLPFAGSSITSVGVIMMSGIPMRLAVLTSSVCWFIYSVWIGSIGSALNEVVMTTLNLNTIYRKMQAKKREATSI